MSTARPHALSNTVVYLGSKDFPDLDSEPAWKRNPRLGILGRTYANLFIGDDREIDTDPSGPYYQSLTDEVVQPWNSPEATLHELGHAIDINGNKPLADPGLRRAYQNFKRDMYVLAPIPGKRLWMEHAAWRKGKDAYLEGALKKEVSPDKVKEMLQDVSHAKHPALGTYWGGAIGGTAGLLGGLAALTYARHHNFPVSARVLAGFPIAGSLIGTLGGMGIGALTRRPAEKRVERFVKNVYEKKLRQQQSRRQIPGERQNMLRAA